MISTADENDRDTNDVMDAISLLVCDVNGINGIITR